MKYAKKLGFRGKKSTHTIQIWIQIGPVQISRMLAGNTVHRGRGRRRSSGPARRGSRGGEEVLAGQSELRDGRGGGGAVMARWRSSGGAAPTRWRSSAGGRRGRGARRRRRALQVRATRVAGRAGHGPLRAGAVREEREGGGMTWCSRIRRRRLDMSGHGGDFVRARGRGRLGFRPRI